MSPKFSFVLPCYNEAETIPWLFERCSEMLSARTDVEIIFVNNGSQDKSAAVFAAEISRPDRSWAHVVTVRQNIGYGAGIMAGLRAARGEFIGWTHADSQYNPRILLESADVLMRASAPGKTLVQGRRVGRNWFDSFFTGAMTIMASAMLRTRVNDINAQPKLFPRDLLAAMNNPPNDFSLDVYVLFLARRQGYGITRFPVTFGERTHGEAKGGGSLRLKWKLTKRTWTFLRQLRRSLTADF